MKRKHEIKPGTRVAHRSLNEERGTAQTGIVEDIVGDEEHGLVIIREGGRTVGYDRREIKELHGPSADLVILRPRHLLGALRTSVGLISMLLAFALGGALVDFSRKWHWSHPLSIAVGVGLVVIAVVAARASLWSERRQRR